MRVDFDELALGVSGQVISSHSEEPGWMEFTDHKAELRASALRLYTDWSFLSPEDHVAGPSFGQISTTSKMDMVDRTGSR